MGRYATRTVTVLCDLAEFEPGLTRTRLGKGKARPVEYAVLGRKPDLRTSVRKAIARREAGEVLTDIARSYSTMSRLN